jgi:ABC-type cobalt transport system substrate-binding protein
LVDFDAYLASLKRLAALPVQALCQAHHGVFTGSDARDYLQSAQAAAQDYRAWVESLLQREGGDVERVVELVKRREYDARPGPKQPEPAYLLNLRTRVEHLKERMARAR